MPGYNLTAETLLMLGVERGNLRGVEDALAAGARVDGSSKLARTPLMEAVLRCHDSIAKLLVEKGADLEICAQRDPCVRVVNTGMQVIHFAAFSGRLDVLRVLLQAGANPNSADEKGCTPLMLACPASSARRVLITRELLKEGADPAQLDRDGSVALHYAAILGDVDTIDTLLSQAPLTLNHSNFRWKTPPSVAVEDGRENVVSYLLSAGASNNAILAAAEGRVLEGFECPFGIAVCRGHENVVRLLLDVGLEAVGGVSVITRALVLALRSRQRRILHRLLNAEGEKRRKYWARRRLEGARMIHFAAAFGYPVGTSVILAAGADETDEPIGQRVRDVIGISLPDKEHVVEEAAAVLRTLEQAPAFRAQSWTWPSRRGTGTAAATAATDAAPSSSRTPRVPLDVRVFRPWDRESFVKLIGRYSQKP